jgi:hypothetical protein
MAAIVGLALICCALVVLRVSAVGVRMNPAPWWASDSMTSYASVPFCVAAMAGGAASLLSWLLGGGWRATTVMQGVVIAAIIAGYVLAKRAIRAWALRVQPALAAAEASNDPKMPPRVPPMKKAA